MSQIENRTSTRVCKFGPNETYSWSSVSHASLVATALLDIASGFTPYSVDGVCLSDMKSSMHIPARLRIWAILVPGSRLDMDLLLRPLALGITAGA